MLKIFKEHMAEIERYCNNNNLSADKFFAASWAGNETSAVLQHVDFNSPRAQLGLLDDEPAPITLKIHLENGKLRFEQTDITHKYLGVEKVEKDVAQTTSPKVTRTARPSIKSRRKLAFA